MSRNVLVVLVLPLFLATAVRADDDDAVEDAKDAKDLVADAKKSLDEVRKLVNADCPGAARTALAAAEAKVNALGEFDKDKVKSKLDDARKHIDRFKQWTAEDAQRGVDAAIYGLKESISQMVTALFPGSDDRRYDEANAHLDQVLGDEVNKPLITADTLSKIATQREGFRADYAKARVKDSAKLWDRYRNESNYGETKGWENDKALSVDEIGKWGRKIGCERSQAFSDQVWDWLATPTVKTALERWDSTGSLKKLGEDLDAQRKKANENVVRITKEVLDTSEKLPAGDMRKTMDIYFRQVLSRYGHHRDQDKPEQPAKPAKKGKGKGSSGGGRTPEGYPGGTELFARIIADVNRWDEEDGKRKEDSAARTKKQMTDAEEMWPEMVKHLKAGKLDPTDAQNNPAAWKGKVVVVPGRELMGSSYEPAQYWSIVEVDSVPVCADLDPDVDSLLQAYIKRTGFKPGYGVQGRIGVVEGPCKVWQLVKDRVTDKLVRGNQIEAVRVRLVGVKMDYCAAACGMGTSDLRIDGSSGSGASEGSASGGGGGGLSHMLHRFVAWGMCALLALCGALTAAVGASPFVPALQEQKAKLGKTPGYAGLAFAGIGVLWFGAALLFWFFGKGGSLPSLALVFAGAFTGLVVLRSKGEIKPAPVAEGAAVVPPQPPASPDTLTTIQPLGILLGLSCFGAAAAHFLFWDVILL